MFDLIILASGVGSRCGLDYPKQFYKINNKSMLSYVIDLFGDIIDIQNIIVTTIPDQLNLFNNEIKSYKNIKFIEGANTRQESVYNALKFVKGSKVIIHEAVRPMITKEYIEELLLLEEECIVPYAHITNTVYSKDVNAYINREDLYSIQLPQIYPTKQLKDAHNLARINNNIYTDDSSLYFNELQTDIHFVKGLCGNIKITSQSDLALLNKIRILGGI